MLSVCILTHEGDFHFVEGLHQTLPEWCEVITVITKKQDLLEDRGLVTAPRLYNIKQEGRFKMATYLYSGVFNFAEARNKAMSLASNDWILHLDPDERIMPWQHDYLEQLIKHGNNNQTIGGFINRSYSLIAGDKDENGFMAYEVLQQVRLHRKDERYKFQNAIHESVEESITTSERFIHDSQLFIHHLGYEIPKEKLQAKVERNIDTLLSDPQQLRQERGRKILNELYFLKNKLEK